MKKREKAFNEIIDTLWCTTECVAYDELSDTIIVGPPDKLAFKAYGYIIVYGRSFLVMLGNL